MWAQANSHCYSPGWKKMCFCQQMQTVPGSNLKSQANSHGLLPSKITLLPVSCIPLQRLPAVVFSSSCLVSTVSASSSFWAKFALKTSSFCSLSCVIEDWMPCICRERQSLLQDMHGLIYLCCMLNWRILPLLVGISQLLKHFNACH